MNNLEQNKIEDIYINSNDGEHWEERDGVPTLIDMDLDKVAWVLRNNNSKIAQLGEDLARQLEKLRACTQREIEKIEGHSAVRTELAFSKMKSMKLEKKHFPGVGKFSIGKKAESINTGDYEILTPEQKQALHKSLPFLFATKEKVEIKPDKVAIKMAIKKKMKTGEEFPWFHIDGGQDQMKFKEE